MDALVRDAKAIFRQAVLSVQADQLPYPKEIEDCRSHVQKHNGAIYVLAAGKAAVAMAHWVDQALGNTVAGGLAVVPHGYTDSLPANTSQPDWMDVTEAGHPVPDVCSVKAASRALDIAKGCGSADALLVLLSGGASALWSAPASVLTLDHMANVNRILLKSGADIHQINTLRKHLSRIKGGQLAAAAWPAHVVTIAISDVTGDDMAVIGSGPATGDATTFADCIELVRTLDLDLPNDVMKHLELGAEGRICDTPNPDDPRLEAAQSTVVATNQTALTAAAAEAENRGYTVTGVEQDVTGEARHLGARMAQRALKLGPMRCLLWGGESTVVVRGKGKGGRNQELVLAAADSLAGARGQIVILSGGTDGIDGPTDAAGAWATPNTVPCGEQLGLDVQQSLQHNDAYTYLAAVDQLIRTGPTHTNVMDIGLALTGARDV